MDEKNRKAIQIALREVNGLSRSTRVTSRRITQIKPELPSQPQLKGFTFVIITFNIWRKNFLVALYHSKTRKRSYQERGEKQQVVLRRVWNELVKLQLVPQAQSPRKWRLNRVSHFSIYQSTLLILFSRTSRLLPLIIRRISWEDEKIGPSEKKDYCLES